MKREDLIEVVIDDGSQFAYYKGVRLPYMINSEILDNAGEMHVIGKFDFFVNLVNDVNKLDINESLNEKISIISKLNKKINDLTLENEKLKKKKFFIL